MIAARHVIPFAAALLCAACSGGAGNHAAATDANSGAEAETNIADAVSVPSNAATGEAALSGYVGKYPFDEVGGATFLANPLVTGAVTAAVGDKAVLDWVLNPGAGPSGPIILKDGRLLSTGCQAHNCGDHRWTILIDPAGTAAQVCYHNAETMGEAGQWYSGGKREARTDICPQE
ncbi:hypothetical protein ACMT1E_14515 [Sphingomonas flavalba]|uniref:hypothetical protein n=1 Tax=Sphingomonas flavalba TaxID=2559804 RepID=UPI0039E0F998